MVCLIAITFYFWERYLFRHFLGGFNAQGLSIPVSKPGYSFFIKAWPLWLFPLALYYLIMRVYKKKRIEGLKAHVRLIEQERINQTEKIETLEKELQVISDYSSRQSLTTFNSESKKQLEMDYQALQKDYQLSLDFIEKLLLKLKAED